MDGSAGPGKAGRDGPSRGARAPWQASGRGGECARGAPGAPPPKRDRLIRSELDLPALLAKIDEKLGAPDLRQRQAILRSCRHAMRAGPSGFAPPRPRRAKGGAKGLRGLLNVLRLCWRG